MSALKISFGGGNIAVATESTAGTVHTNIHLIPMWYLLIPIALGILLWFALRGRKDSN